LEGRFGCPEHRAPAAVRVFRPPRGGILRNWREIPICAEKGDCSSRRAVIGVGWVGPIGRRTDPHRGIEPLLGRGPSNSCAESLPQEVPAMIGPGVYVPDPTEGITRPEDLPPPRIVHRRRIYRRRPCPRCGHQSAPRYDTDVRRLLDFGDLNAGRPVELHFTYSRHRCRACRACFSADLTDLAEPKSHYTRRVQELAVRVVVEDGMPYRPASWHLWRDHRVFVPFATIQNWVEAAGKKKPDRSRDGVPGPGSGPFQRVHRHRRVVPAPVLHPVAGR